MSGCPSGKKRYGSKKEAKAVFNPKATRTYYCNLCFGWHKTHQKRK